MVVASPSAGTDGVALSPADGRPAGWKRTATLSARRTRTDTTALKTLYSLGVTTAASIAGGRGGATPIRASPQPARSSAAAMIPRRRSPCSRRIGGRARFVRRIRVPPVLEREQSVRVELRGVQAHVTVARRAGAKRGDRVIIAVVEA